MSLRSTEGGLKFRCQKKDIVEELWNSETFEKICMKSHFNRFLLRRFSK